MKVSKNFILQEFVPKSIYEKFGNNSIWFIDPKIFKIVQFFRDRYNLPITINDWVFGGNRNYSGFRHPDINIGAYLSQHKFGRAIDMKWLTKDKSFVEYVREDIRSNQKIFMEIGMTTVEEKTDGWLHIDCRHTGLDHILFVKG